MEREPDERIRVVRVFDNCYRCNWWVQGQDAASRMARIGHDPPQPTRSWDEDH